MSLGQSAPAGSSLKTRLSLAVGLAGTAALAWYLRRRHLEQQRERRRISRVFVYPIKGCKGVQLHSAKLLQEGLKHDREYLIVRPATVGAGWEKVSQREIPMIVCIKPSLPFDDGTLVVKAPEMAPLVCEPPKEDSQRIAVDIFGDAAEGLDCGDRASEWLCQFLGAAGLRLVRHTGTRRIDETFAQGVTKFSDGFPLLITTEASLADVERTSGLGRSCERFRPNLVLGGSSKFAEDLARGIRCNGARFEFVKPCARCTVPRVDPATGINGADPIRAMKPYRSGKVLGSQSNTHQGHYASNRGDTFFGQNAVPLEFGDDIIITEGDRFEWL